MKSKLKAVALKYPRNAEAPFITANESGVLAGRMIEIAKENNIPVVEDEVLGNVLSLQQIGECIPEETWMGVAAVFAAISRMEGNDEYSTEN